MRGVRFKGIIHQRQREAFGPHHTIYTIQIGGWHAIRTPASVQVLQKIRSFGRKVRSCKSGKGEGGMTFGVS